MANETVMNKGRKVYDQLDFTIRKGITAALHKENVDDYRYLTGERNEIYGMFIDLSFTEKK